MRWTAGYYCRETYNPLNTDAWTPQAYALSFYNGYAKTCTGAVCVVQTMPRAGS